MTLTLTCSVR